MIIKNYKKLASTPLRQHGLKILETGLKKANPHSLLAAAVRYNDDFNSVTVHTKTFDLLSGRIFVVGGGKAAGHMAESLEEIIGADNITAGVVNCKSAGYKTAKIKVHSAGHPLPDKNGVRGVEKMLLLKEEYNIGEKDLVICVISGGGSALLPSPVDEIELKDKQKITEMLIESGAEIQEINSVRKHLSKIKGGQLAAHFAPATVVSLIISDVVGNRLEAIASGPTVPDPTTFEYAQAILAKYELLDKAPTAIKNYIARGVEGDAKETPREVDNAYNYIIGDKAYVLEAMSHQAKLLGYNPLIVTSELQGKPKPAAVVCVEELFAQGSGKYNAFFFGGELTPKLPAAHGKGGRNQHFVALAMLNMKNYAASHDWLIIGASTDGADFTPDTAGAVADNGTLSKIETENINIVNYISEFDTYNLFKKIGNAHIKTGDTGTNVGDIAMFLIKR